MALLQTPVADDKSLSLLNEIFKLPVNNLSGTISPITDMLYIWTNLLMGVAGIIIILGLVTSVFNTAHQGEALGRRWNSAWVPLRAVIAIALLIPMGWFGNMNLAQRTVIFIAEGGAGLADAVWNTGFSLISIPVSKPAEVAGVNTVYRVAQAIMCQEVKRGLPSTAADEMTFGTKYTTVSTFSLMDLGMVAKIKGRTSFGNQTRADADCGHFDWTEPDPATTDNITKAVYAKFPLALMHLERTMRPAIQVMVAGINQGKTTTVTTATFQQYVTQFEADMRAGATNGYNSQFGNNNLNMAQMTGGWGEAGAYAVKLTQASNLSLNAMNDLPPFTIGKNFAAATTNPTFEIGLTHLKPMMQKVQAQQPLPAIYTAEGMKQRVLLIMKQDVYPMQRIIQIGNLAQNALTGFYVAAFGAKTVGAIAKGALKKVPALGNVVERMTGVTSELMIPITLILFPIALLFSVIIPAMPFVIFVTAVAGFIIMVAEGLIAAPLWCLTWLDPESDKLVPDQAMKGFMSLVSILIRPTMMIFGLIFGFLIFNYVGYWAGNGIIGLGNFFDTSLMGILFIVILYGSVLLALAYASFELIHTLPNALMHWINFEGRDDGVKEAISGQQKDSANVTGVASSTTRPTAGKGNAGNKNGSKSGSGGGSVSEAAVNP